MPTEYDYDKDCERIEEEQKKRHTRTRKVISPEQIYEEVFEEPWAFCSGCNVTLPLKYLRGRDGALKCVDCIRQTEGDDGR